MKRLVCVYISFMGMRFFSGLMISRVFTPPTPPPRHTHIHYVTGPSIDKRAPSFTVASGGVSAIVCMPKQYSVQGLLTVFFGESSLFFLFCPYIHDSIHPSAVMLWCQPPAPPHPPHVSGCSQTVLMAHQVVTALQLFYCIPFFMSWEGFLFSFFDWAVKWIRE